MYAASIPGKIIELKMPDGVGVPLPAGTQIVLNMHFINLGTTPTHPQVKVNFLAHAESPVQGRGDGLVQYGDQRPGRDGRRARARRR